MKNKFVAASCLLVCLIAVSVVPAFSQSLLPAEVLDKLTSSVFEVVVPKPLEGNLEYERRLPMERIAFSIRTDKFVPIGTAFLMEDSVFYSAAHVFNLMEKSVYKDYYIRDRDGNTYPVDTITKFATNRDFITFTVKNFKPKAGMGLKGQTEFSINSKVFSVGNALGEGVVIRDGVLTSQTYEVKDGEWKWLRFSAAASPGNSGGPLVNSAGEVLGIITMKSENENLNYALPLQEAVQAPLNKGVSQTSFYYTIPNIQRSDFYYIFKHNLVLPKTLAETQRILISEFNSFTQKIVADIQKEYEFTGPQAFTHADGSDQIMYNSFSPSFPYTILLSENQKWDMYYPKDISEYKLPDNGLVRYGSMMGFTMALISKPDSVSLEKLISSPKLYMDYILSASRIYRYVGNEKVGVTSYGEPVRTNAHTDCFGRVWLVSYWDIAFSDMMVVSYALPLPSGIFVVSKLDDTGSIMNGHNLDLAFVSDYIFPGYRGTVKEWNEYVSLPAKTYKINPVFSSVSFDYSISGALFKLPFAQVKVPYEIFQIDDKTQILLSTGFYFEKDVLKNNINVLTVRNSSKNDDYRHFSVVRTINPENSDDKNLKENWEVKIKQSTPYNGEPYDYELYTYYDEILFPKNTSPEQRQNPDSLYHLELELRGTGKHAEIKKFASELKENIVLP